MNELVCAVLFLSGISGILAVSSAPTLMGAANTIPAFSSNARSDVALNTQGFGDMVDLRNLKLYASRLEINSDGTAERMRGVN
jgi:hypothetical protein